MLKKLILATVTVFAVGALSVAVNSPVTNANGKNSPTECWSNQNKNPDTYQNVKGGQEGTASAVTVTVDEGNVVDGVCIKAGNKTAFGDATKHSGVITSDGNYGSQTKKEISPCYNVSGIGTQTVTVTRINSECQDISHIDVLFSEEDEPEEPETPVTPETPRTPVTPTQTDVEEEEDQVEAPAAGVNAGSGDAATAAVAAVTLIGSLASLAYGVVRFTKFGA